MEDDDPVASRTRSQTEPVVARPRQSLGSDPEVSAFADVKKENTLNEWLHEIAFEDSWWDPDLIAREKWQEVIHLEFKKMLDMGVWRHVNRKDHPQDQRLVGC